MLKAIIDGLRVKIEAALPGVEVFLGEPAPHIEEFPFIVFNLTSVAQQDYMGNVYAHDPVGEVSLAFFEDADKGSGALREIEEKVHEALHRKDFEAEGYEGCGLWCQERGDVELIPDTNTYATMDFFEFYGSKVKE